MSFEDVDVVINGEYFSKWNWYRQIALNIDGSNIELPRIFNKTITGPRSKRATHQVMGNALVRVRRKNKKFSVEVEIEGKVLPLDNSEVSVVKNFLKSNEALKNFLLRKEGSSIENYLPVQMETLIEEKKRLAKESFETKFGINVPASYSFSPSLGLNYYPKNLDMTLPKILEGDFECFGVTRIKGVPKVKKLSIENGEIINWRKHQYLVMIEHNAYSGLKGPYGCKLDVFRTKPKED